MTSSPTPVEQREAREREVWRELAEEHHSRLASDLVHAVSPHRLGLVVVAMASGRWSWATELLAHCEHGWPEHQHTRDQVAKGRPYQRHPDRYERAFGTQLRRAGGTP